MLLCILIKVKLLGLVADNAATNVAAVNLLNHEGNDLTYVEDRVTLLRCVCHTMDLVLEDYCKHYKLKPIIIKL
jgi:hypothetical protein